MTGPPGDPPADPEISVGKTEDTNVNLYTIIQSANIKIADKREIGFFFDNKNKKSSDKFVHYPVPIGADGQTGYFVALLDGHGYSGCEVSEFAAKKLPKLIKTHLRNIKKVHTKTIKNAVNEALKILSQYVKDQTVFDAHFSGCTICASLILNDYVYTWQIGDSLALKFDYEEDKTTKKHYKAEAMCDRHTLKISQERNRIKNAGGKIAKLSFEDIDNNEHFGMERIYLKGESCHALMKTRTIGNILHHENCGVTDEASMTHLKITNTTKYFVWVTDEYFKEDSLTTLIEKHHGMELEQLCEKILEFCSHYNEKVRNQRSNNQFIRDDISVVMIEMYPQESKNVEKAPAGT